MSKALKYHAATGEWVPHNYVYYDGYGWLRKDEVGVAVNYGVLDGMWEPWLDPQKMNAVHLPLLSSSCHCRGFVIARTPTLHSAVLTIESLRIWIGWQQGRSRHRRERASATWLLPVSSQQGPSTRRRSTLWTLARPATR